MMESSRLRDGQLGGEDPVVAQEGHRTPARRRAGAVTAWTRGAPSPRLLR